MPKTQVSLTHSELRGIIASHVSAMYGINFSSEHVRIFLEGGDNPNGAQQVEVSVSVSST